MRTKLAFLLFTIFMNFIYSCDASMDMKEQFDTGLICVMTRSSILDMNDCGIDDNKAVFISEFLKESKVIKQIKLNSNNISDVGISALGKMFATLPGLEEINVAHNKFGDEGAKDLFNSLKSVWSLRFLDIRGNSFSEESLLSLVELLSSNPRLTLESTLSNFKNAF